MPTIDFFSRAAALVGAAAVTAVLVGSQLYIANHYTDQADAVLAAKRAAVVTAQSASGAQLRQPRGKS